MTSCIMTHEWLPFSVHWKISFSSMKVFSYL
jgi:hypothetical protein